MQMDYPWVSTYGYCIDNPVKLVDINGKEWKYSIDEHGNVHISVDISLEVNATLSNDQVEFYKNGINYMFNSMLQNATNNIVSGSVTFNGNQIEGIHTPIMSWSMDANSGIAGNHGNGYIYVNLLDRNNMLKSIDVFASDVIHELLHDLRLDHPFELTQTLDTELIKIGHNSFVTTKNTIYSISTNVMNYDFITINGFVLKETNSNALLNSISPGQIQLMMNEIDLQQKGAGFLSTDSYWSKTPGYEVKTFTNQ